MDAHYELNSVPSSIPAARHAVASLPEISELAGAVRDDILLAVSEAVTNVVRHAYHANPRTIELAIRAVVGELTITVTDHGLGLGAASPSPSLGLGIGLIKRTADYVAFLPVANGGTTIEMQFRRLSSPESS